MGVHTSDYNRSGMIAFVFSMAFSIAFFIYISFIHPGVDLQEISEAPEAPALAPVAEDGAGAAAPAQVADVSAIQDPWNESPALIDHGSKLYQANCAFCHGAGGKGDGPAGAGLSPKPRDLVAGKWTKGGKPSELFTTLTEGIQGTSMAGYAHLPAVDRWALVHYVRSLTQNKVAQDEQELAAFAQKVK